MPFMILLEIVGIVGMVQGFGSAVVTEVLDGNWALMRWALDYQPVIGIAIGIAGFAVASAGWAGQKRIKAGRR